MSGEVQQMERSIGNLHMRLTRETQRDLDAAAARLNLTYTSVIRLALREFCERHGLRVVDRSAEGGRRG